MSIKNNDIVDDALQYAANKTGRHDLIPYLKKVARPESMGDIYAANPKSNARGIWQIMPDTYTQYIPKHPELAHANGYGQPRFNPYNNALAAMEETIANEKTLNRHVKTEFQLTDGTRYLAHFAGGGGASSLINAPADTSITKLLSAATIAQNEDVRLNMSNGKEKYFKDFTAGDLRVWANQKMDQPVDYEGMTTEKRNQWRKERNISPSTPDAFGDLKGFLEVIIDVVKSIGSMLAGMFSGNASGTPRPNNTVVASKSQNQQNLT